MTIPKDIKVEDFGPRADGGDMGRHVSEREVNQAISHMNDKEYSRDLILDLMYFCLVSTENTCRILFPERFYKPFSKKIHHKIFAILDDYSIQQFCIVAPRGVGKTTIDTIVYPARRLLFTENQTLFCPFYVPIGNNESQAIMQAENLKRELIANWRIRKIFGSIKTRTNVDLGLPFSTKQWSTHKDSLVFPRGRGQPVRGILWFRYRPFLIIGDDLEDKEEVRNEERRADTREWWREDVGNSIERGRQDWRIGVVGSMLHEDSLLANLAGSSAWETTTLSIATNQFVSNWPEHMSDTAVKKLRDQHYEDNMLDSFYREFMSVAAATEDASFKGKYFRHYEETDEAFQTRVPRLINVILGDPAKTEKMQSADSAIVGAAIDPRLNSFFVRDVVCGKMYPDEFYDNLIDMGLKLRKGSTCDHIGVEVTGLEEFLLNPLKNRMMERRVNFEIVPLKARRGTGEFSGRGKGKEGRVSGLVKYYRQGNVWHNVACCGELEAQLISFPRSKKWDIMDAWAYITYMLEQGLIYFTPPSEPDEDPALLEVELMNQEIDVYDEEDLKLIEEGSWKAEDELGGYFPTSLDEL